MAGEGVRIAFVSICLVTLGGAAAGTPTSQPAQGETNLLDSLVRNLGNPDPRVRDAGRTALLRLRREDLAELKKAMAKSRPLLPAQTSALRVIVRQIYLAEEKYNTDGHGFLGIIMDGSNPDADLVPGNDTTDLGVVVTERIPGFCAARWLLDGDIVLGMARPFVPFHRTNDLRTTIGPMKPGTNVGLLVLRQGQLTTVVLKPDPNPQEIQSIDQIPGFEAEREKRFTAYWNQEFRPLLNAKVAG
jgi:hypothetical protein